jgi:hypothetical protein
MMWLQLTVLVLTGYFASRVEAGTVTISLHEILGSNVNEASPSSVRPSSTTKSTGSQNQQCGRCTLSALNPEILTFPNTYTPPSISLTVEQTIIQIITYNADSKLIGDSFETQSVTIPEGTHLYTPPSWTTFGTWL